MLVWTIAVVPLFVLAKEFNWSRFLSFGWHDVLPALTLGSGFAVLSLVGMWAALGEARGLVRLAVLSMMAPAVGALLTWLIAAQARLMGSPRRWDHPFFDMAKDIGYTWIAWTSLAAGFLAASLLIFRARGYRLLRKRKNGTPLTNG
jgi:hypothetical protein